MGLAAAWKTQTMKTFWRQAQAAVLVSQTSQVGHSFPGHTPAFCSAYAHTHTFLTDVVFCISHCFISCQVLLSRITTGGCQRLRATNCVTTDGDLEPLEWFLHQCADTAREVPVVRRMVLLIWLSQRAHSIPSCLELAGGGFASKGADFIGFYFYLGIQLHLPVE